MPKKKSADIEFIRETFFQVSQPRLFHFVMPKGKEWAGIVIGLAFITLAFFFLVIAPYEGTQESLIVGLAMFSYPFYVFSTLIAWSTPTGIEKAIQNLRERTLKAKTVSFPAGPNGEKTESSKGTYSEGWLITPPKIKKWHMDQPYLEDESGLLVDHPIYTGTAVPAMFTMRSLINLAKSLLLAIMGVLFFQISQRPNGIIFILLFGLITFVFRYIKVRKWRAISDLPTSKIRSVAVGKVEVYGQIRPRKSWPPVIDVDNDSSKQMFGMGVWYWEYGHSFSWEEWVEEKDDEGNVTGGRWESKSRYDKQRSDSGEWPMLVHDGTAGMALQEGVLTGGRRIKDWNINDDSLWNRRGRPSGNVKNLNAKHVWYGTGWSMGDPLFISGYATPRDNSILESENVDMTQGSALLKLGKKGESFGHAVTVHRGTELLALNEMESGIATLLPSICMILISGIPLLLSFM